MMMIVIIKTREGFFSLLLPALEIEFVEKGSENQLHYLDLPQGEKNLQKLTLARTFKSNSTLL